MVDPKIKKELEEVKAYFKKIGLRWTTQREVIVEQAFLTHSHFHADDLLNMIKKRLGPSAAHLATIYRTLQVLEEGHFVEGLELSRSEGRLFEHILGHEHHDHVICEDCGKIFEFSDAELERRKEDAAKQLGLTMISHLLRIFGSCDALKRDGSCEHLDSASAKS